MTQPCEHEALLTVEVETFPAEYSDCGSHRLKVRLVVDPLLQLPLLKKQIAEIESILSANGGKPCVHITSR